MNTKDCKSVVTLGTDVFLVYITLYQGMEISSQMYTHSIGRLSNGLHFYCLSLFSLFYFLVVMDSRPHVRQALYSGAKIPTLMLIFNSFSPKSISVWNHTNNLCDKFLKCITVKLNEMIFKSIFSKNVNIWNYSNSVCGRDFNIYYMITHM